MSDEKNNVEEDSSVNEEAITKNAVKKTVDKKEDSGSEEKPVVDKAAKLVALKAKAAELAAKVKDVDASPDLKSQVKAGKDHAGEDTLVPIEDYLKSSMHLGTRVITPDMREYVYKRRADGLAVFNTALLDKKVREVAKMLAKYAPEDVIVVCKREAGWKAVELFADATGVRMFTKKYPAGILTNPDLDNFLETELVMICDPWIDKNALEDAKRMKVPVLSVCDTNNYTFGVTEILPGNNKSAKSLGMIFYLLTKMYVEERGLKSRIPDVSEFIENWENLTPPK